LCNVGFIILGLCACWERPRREWNVTPISSPTPSPVATPPAVTVNDSTILDPVWTGDEDKDGPYDPRQDIATVKSDKKENLEWSSGSEEDVNEEEVQ